MRAAKVRTGNAGASDGVVLLEDTHTAADAVDGGAVSRRQDVRMAGTHGRAGRVRGGTACFESLVGVKDASGRDVPTVFFTTASDGRVYRVGRVLQPCTFGVVAVGHVCASTPPAAGGGASLVTSGAWRESGELVALKIMRKASMARGRRWKFDDDAAWWTGFDTCHVGEDPWLELDVLSELRDAGTDGVVRLIDVLDTDNFVVAVLEFMRGGDAHSVVVERGPLSEADARAAVRQLLSALAAGHARGVAQRDVSPENLMFADAPDGVTPPHVKVCDYGGAERMERAPGADPADPHGVVPRRRATAKEAHRAPEVYLGMPSVGWCADMWAVGTTAFFLMTGSRLWVNPNAQRGHPQCDAAFAYFARHGLHRLLACAAWQPMCGHFSDEARDFLAMLLQVDPAARPTAEQALAHPWLACDDSNDGADGADDADDADDTAAVADRDDGEAAAADDLIVDDEAEISIASADPVDAGAMGDEVKEDDIFVDVLA